MKTQIGQLFTLSSVLVRYSIVTQNATLPIMADLFVEDDQISRVREKEGASHKWPQTNYWRTCQQVCQYTLVGRIIVRPPSRTVCYRTVPAR